MHAWTSIAVSQWLPIWGCLSEDRATHCHRDMIDPGLLPFGSAKVAPRIPDAGPRSVSLPTAFPATPAAIRPPAVRRHVSKIKAALTPIELHFPADPTGVPPNLDVGRLK